MVAAMTTTKLYVKNLPVKQKLSGEQYLCACNIFLSLSSNTKNNKKDRNRRILSETNRNRQKRTETDNTVQKQTETERKDRY